MRNIQTVTGGYDNNGMIQIETIIDQWKRLLNTRKQQNVLLKTRLSEILKDKYDQKLLEELEYFQTEFIGEDIYIDSLRKEVNDLEALSATAYNEAEPAMDASAAKLADAIAKSTIRFCKLKSKFNKFSRKVFSNNG